MILQEQSVVCGRSVWAVPTRLRPLASGVSAIASHILGDVPTPPLVGLLQGNLIPVTKLPHARHHIATVRHLCCPKLGGTAQLSPNGAATRDCTRVT